MAVSVAPYVEHVVSKDKSEEWNECVGDVLKQLRKAADLTQDDVAKKVGKSRRTIIDIEAGKGWNLRLVSALIFDVYDSNPANVNLKAYALWKARQMPVDLDLDNLDLK